MDYHLSISGESSGPYSQFHIIEGIREGRFKGDELIWHVGVPEWVPLKEAVEFESYWPITEQARLQAEAARLLARAELDRPRPWLRFWARVLDYLWFTFVISLLLRPLLMGNMEAMMTDPVLRYVPWDTALLLFYIPLESWLLSTFGTTPGRALLRIQVRRLDGSLPSFRQAMARSFQVFLKGLALGLPVVYFLAMAWWRIRLLQKGVTTWDEACETRVEHGEPEVWRYLTLAGIILGVGVVAMLALAMFAEQMRNLPN